VNNAASRQATSTTRRAQATPVSSGPTAPEHGRDIRFALRGALTWVGWLLLLSGVSIAIQQEPLSGYRLAISHIAGLGWLLASYWLYRRKAIAGSGIGVPASQRVWMLGSAGILAIYLVHFAFTLAAGTPREPFMALLYVNKTPADIAVLLLTACVIAPVAEELAYRYFLLGALPYRRGKGWAVAAGLLTSVVFMGMHVPQYVYPSTWAVMFAVACVFAWARIASGGLVAPIALHALASAVALVSNELR